MALTERPPSEEESLSTFSRIDSFLSESSEPAGYGGLLLNDDSDMWSSSTEDIHSTRESVLSEVGMRGAKDKPSNNQSINEGVPPPASVINKREILRQSHLRRQIDGLREKKLQMEDEVEKQEESLKACRQHLKSLHSQRADLQYRVAVLGGQIEADERGGEGRGSVASCGFLRGQLGRLNTEISREEEVEREIVDKLQAAQLQLSIAILACSEYQLTEESLQEVEKRTHTAKNLQALQRLQNQTRMRVNADRTRRAQERLLESNLKQQEMQTQAAIERARLSQDEGRTFLHKTLERQREREAKEGRREREEMEKRMSAVLSLKKNTESSKGTIQALHMLREERDRKERTCEEKRRRLAVLDGDNPDEVILRKKRENEFSKKKAQFEENRRQKHVKIVSKLLKEQKLKKRSEKITSKAHWQGRWPSEPTRARHQENLGREKTHKHGESDSVQVDDGANPIISGEDEKQGPGGESSDDDNGDGGVSGEEETQGGGSDQILTEPEIKGLWNRQIEMTRESMEEEEGGGERGGRGRGKGRSKLEQKMLTNVVDNLKKSVVRRQVAAGREFKGCPFTSNPEAVEFKDFSPGDCLKCRLTLTNVTYTVNYCKLVGLSPHLMDFITVNFNPPGALSAGLTCHMTVTFEPKLNEDMEGEIKMLSQTGPFSIPVHCSTRKCSVRVTGQGEGGGGGGAGGGGGDGVEEKGREVNFGRVCIGETVRKWVALHNDGALTTDFTITSGKCDQKEEDKPVTSDPVPADSAHIASSVPSEISVMSEVRGDWGPVGRVKSDNRPVSRSASELPQLVIGRLPPTNATTTQDSKPATSRAEPSSPEPTSPDDGTEAIRGKGRKEGKSQPSDQHKPIAPVSQELVAPLPEKQAVQDIILGKNQTGCLKGYSSYKIELIYSPLSTSVSSQQFNIHFSQPGVPPITILAKGEGSALPVYVTRDNIDLRICTINRLYQDSIEICNRGSTALRMSFVLPPKVGPHLEIFPPHGLVQGASSFSAQIKFLPLHGILTDCEKYFENDRLTIPAEIHVVDQVCPVPFTIRARVTSSDLEFSSTDIDFGTCTIHESVVSRLEITNTSILPQEFGFVHLPEFVDVQPNDGFGTLLPRETVSLDVIFSASKPRDYSFELSCLTEYNRTFKISCKGRGVLPALELSGNVVNFAATSLNTRTTARISITNPKLSRLSSPVIRGAVLPQGPKAFEFLVPDGVPMEISPRVGTLSLDETVSIELSYLPSLAHSDIREEAVQLATEAAVSKRSAAAELAAQQSKAATTPTTEPRKDGGKRTSSRAGSQTKAKKSSTSSTVSGRVSETSDRRSGGGGGELGASGEGVTSRVSDGGENGVKPNGEDRVKVDIPEEGSEMWQRAATNLLDRFQNRTDQFSITCFVSSEAPKSELDPVPYRPEDTLYVEVSVPVVKPALVIISNAGGDTVNFGPVAIGDAVLRKVTVKNTSDHSIQLTSSPLDPHGPFDMRNALRSLSSTATHTLVFQYTPQQAGKYYEMMKLFYAESCGMELRLIGEAVDPHVVLEPDTNRIDFGHTYTGDTCIKKLLLKNTCTLGVRYRVRVQGRNGKSGKVTNFRPANYSGQPVFDCIPFQGRMEPDGTTEVEVFFSPDHQSHNFSDNLHIDINDSPTYTLALSGHAWSTTMFVWGGDNNRDDPFVSGGKRVEFESMAARMPPPDGHQEPVEPVVVLFQSQNGVEEGGESRGEVKRELEIGCIKTASVKKNTGDFSVEPIPPSNPHAKCFSFEPTKSGVEPGSTRTLTITFHPPNTGPQAIIEANTNLILKGDTTRVCRLLLRAITYE